MPLSKETETNTIICDIIRRFGTSIIDEPQRCEAIIRDMYVKYRTEANLLITTLKDGMPSEIFRASVSTPIDILLARLSEKLQKEHGLQEDSATWAVQAWGVALGRLSSPVKEEESTQIEEKNESDTAAENEDKELASSNVVSKERITFLKRIKGALLLTLAGAVIGLLGALIQSKINNEMYLDRLFYLYSKFAWRGFLIGGFLSGIMSGSNLKRMAIPFYTMIGTMLALDVVVFKYFLTNPGFYDQGISALISGIVVGPTSVLIANYIRLSSVPNPNLLWNKRLKSALKLSLFGLILGIIGIAILCDKNYPLQSMIEHSLEGWFIFPISGFLSGLLSGFNRVSVRLIYIIMIITTVLFSLTRADTFVLITFTPLIPLYFSLIGFLFVKIK